jgi:pilus assembly protein FimV
MGKEIAPDNPIFAEIAETGLKVADFAPAKPETADLDLSEATGATTPDIELGEEDAASTTTDFDLDLSEGEEDEFEKTLLATPEDEDHAQMMPPVDIKADEGQKEEIEEQETDLTFDLEADADEIASDLDIDFNADELGLATEVDMDAEASLDEAIEEADLETQIEDAEATVALDVTFGLDDEGEESELPLNLDEEIGEDAIELDMGGTGDIDLEDVDAFEEESSASEDLLADLGLGEEGLEAASVDTEFEIPEDDDTIIDADLEDETISGDIGDEVSTKLDLAKAYMDMGDYDGASSTLEEVMAEGDEAQKKEAKELLDQIH